MRIKIEDLPKGVEIRGLVIDLDVNILENKVSNVRVVANNIMTDKVDVEHREPKPIPEEMNQSF